MKTAKRGTNAASARRPNSKPVPPKAGPEPGKGVTPIKGSTFRFLLGAMAQNQLTLTVRYLGLEGEITRLPQLVQAWRQASAEMQVLLAQEAGIADQIEVLDAPADVRARMDEIEADPLFRASFSDMPTVFKVVEIDKLVAPQRDVNRDYVASLAQRLFDKGMRSLVEYCLAPRAGTADVRVLQTAPNQITFSSPSFDLRFLGGYPKSVGEDDVRVAHQGGHPVEAISLLIGFSASPVNAWAVGRRVVLANGFHRVFALREAGVTHVPIVVRQVANPGIEFPDQYLGLPREYLLEHPRPVLVKDFFNSSLTQDLRLKPRIKTLKLTWIPEDGVVPE